MTLDRSVSVCLFQPYLAPYRLGLFNELNRRLGGRLTVLYFSREEESRKWTFERNVDFKEIQIKNTVSCISYDKVRKRINYFSLMAAFLRIKPTIVICQEDPIGRIVRLMQKLFGFRILFWTETNEITLCGAQQKKWLVRWIDRGADAYILPGRLSEQYVRNIRSYAGRIWFAPNTIDRNCFTSTPEEVENNFRNGELRFLFSGSLIPRKGIDSLFDAFERLAKTKGLPEYRLDIIGEGPMEKKAIPNVHYHGFLTQDECALLMKQAHVFVLPSLWDCNPLVVAEAITAGCLTVLSDGVGNWPEYTDGNGIVFERGNADALYEALQRVLKMTREERSQMAMRSLGIASEVTHQNSARIFEKAIRESLQNGAFKSVRDQGTGIYEEKQ